MGTTKKTEKKGPEKLTESQFRRDLVEKLRKIGYTVLTVGGGFSACAKCGGRMVGGNGSSPGVPDLFVRNPEWDIGTYVALELKTEAGKLSEAQIILEKNRGSIVIRPKVCYLEIMLEAIEDVPGKDVRAILGPCFPAS